MVVSHPRKGIVNTEAPDMVRVQLKPGDIRSYRRRDAVQVLESTPGSYIVGEEATPAPPDNGVDEKERVDAPNKARRPGRTKNATEAEGA